MGLAVATTARTFRSVMYVPPAPAPQHPNHFFPPARSFFCFFLLPRCCSIAQFVFIYGLTECNGGGCGWGTPLHGGGSHEERKCNAKLDYAGFFLVLFPPVFFSISNFVSNRKIQQWRWLLYCPLLSSFSFSLFSFFFCVSRIVYV